MTAKPETTGERCSACGAPMECAMRQGRDHCWCEAMPVLETIDPSRTCLCPACLDKALRQEKSATA